ncbi:MAG: septal ring lytic transglycosylase RlpA family protein [Hyphomicrobiales bacterium]
MGERERPSPASRVVLWVMASAGAVLLLVVYLMFFGVQQSKYQAGGPHAITPAPTADTSAKEGPKADATAAPLPDKMDTSPDLPGHHAEATHLAPGAEMGLASWYDFDGEETSSGETMNDDALTAAHPTLPIGSRVLVENVENGEFVVVRINDRGPYEGGRIIDLSRAAAAKIDMIEDGVATVRVRLVQDTMRGTGARASMDYF